MIPWQSRRLQIALNMPYVAALSLLPAFVTAEPRPSQKERIIPAAASKSVAASPRRGERLAAFTMPRLGISFDLLEGTDARTLERSIGHVEGTGLPGGKGNIGIAGHRNTHFRKLEWVRKGDDLLIEKPDRVDRYVVEWVRLVRPEDVHVLDPAHGPAVTLVTCFPFEYVGSAPLRFIVRAVPEGGR